MTEKGLLVYNGRGSIWNVDGANSRICRHHGDIEVRFNADEILLQHGDLNPGVLKKYIPTGVDLNFTVMGYDADLLGQLLGASTTASLSLNLTQGEEVTVTSNAGTLANSTALSTGTNYVACDIYYEETTGERHYLDQISNAGSPSATDEYKASGQTITFYTGQFSDGDIVIADYWYTGTAGTRIRYDTNDTPSMWNIYAMLPLYDEGEAVRQMTIKALNVSLKPDFSLGAGFKSQGSMTLTGSVNNTSAGNFEIYINTV